MSQNSKEKNENHGLDIEIIKELLTARLDPIQSDVSSIKKNIADYSDLVTKQDVRITALEASRTFWRENWYKVFNATIISFALIGGAFLWKNEQDTQIKENSRVEISQTQSINELKNLVRSLANTQ
jgi:hypothetical protein